MPWVDSETLGPNMLGAYGFAYFVMALPNIFITSAIFFAVATMTRSMMYSYVGVVVFLVLYGIVLTLLRQLPDFRAWGGYVEPFGFGAFATATRYWTTNDSNTLTPSLSGMLLVNRLTWIAVGLAALGLAYARFSFTERGASKRTLRRQEKRAAKLATTVPVVVATLPATAPGSAGWARLVHRMRFEMTQVFSSPAFFVLMLIGLLNAGLGLYFANQIYGTPPRPLTFSLIPTLSGAFGIIPVIIAIYYSGELVWRDRERKMHEIIDSTSLPNWAYLVPKVLAVAAVLCSTIIASMIAAIIVQLARGQTDLALGGYVNWYIVPSSVDMILLAILAVFVQALSPNKYVGWAVMVVYFVATVTLGNIGFEHPLYTYGATTPNPLSDMNGNNLGAGGAWMLRLYWSGIALILAVGAHLLWRRGTAVSLSNRLKRAPARLIGVPGALLGLGAITSAASGAFIYYNTNILNPYRTADDGDKRVAVYERKYLKYEKIRQPSTTDIKLAIDLFPHDHRMEVKGRYALVNDTGAPLNDLHVRFADPDLKVVDLQVPGATLVMNDTENAYRIYHFPTPLAPGARTFVTFQTQSSQQGFSAKGQSAAVVDNGTFANAASFTPIIGMDQNNLLSDRIKRRKNGLPAELRPARLEDSAAQAKNYLNDADWVNADITVSTVADQTPIAPGKKVSDVTAGGRRTAHFVSTAPILAFFAVQSATYAEKSVDAKGVRATVLYDPKHAYNVDRMLKAMQLSLNYYRQNFGPYQFDYARIIEFPGYATFAQAFAGTIPYSEGIGFIADTRDPNEIDYVTYVTAHELAHQYWGHQVISANMQGGTVMVETLAQYSALMVMKHLYGEDKIRRFLKYELDQYLRGRGSEALEELPLERVENQGYIHYRKGAVVMYLLQDRLGEDRVNGVLRGLLAKYRFKSQPYARSLDLVDGLKAAAQSDADKQLIGDLFERITIYDLKAKSAKTTKRADGRYQTVLIIAADKFYADGKGKETKARLDDSIQVGLFAARPGIGAFNAKDVDMIERRPIRSGEQEIVVISKKKPAYAGIDPYNKYIDRNSEDNVTAVTG
ncbi:MAG: M1 family aminopeptidase, partial [Sphingomonas sp.]